MKTHKIGDRNKDNQTRKNTLENIKGNKAEEAKVIPLQPSNSQTLVSKITVNSENEDILTPVQDDKQD